MINKLKAELALPAYDGLTDQQATDALNAEFAVRKEYMLTAIRLYNIITLAVGATLVQWLKAQTDAVSEAVYQELSTTGLDVSNPEAIGYFDMLVAGSLITREDADRVLDYGKTTTTRGKQIGFTVPVRLVFIEEARR